LIVPENVYDVIALADKFAEDLVKVAKTSIEGGRDITDFTVFNINELKTSPVSPQFIMAMLSVLAYRTAQERIQRGEQE